MYVGVTNSLTRRLWQHRNSEHDTFTRRYGLFRLVYYERYRDVRRAIAREKEIKGWLRMRKIALIEKENPEWEDISAKWFP